MEYSQSYINISRDNLLKIVRGKVSQNRFDHILRVEEMALKLARLYKQDLEAASVAALMHDMAKEMDGNFMYELAEAYTENPKIKEGNPAIWHGPAAAQLALNQYGLTDQSILEAIACHTLGAPVSNTLAKIIYTADYVEAGRDFKGVDKARQLAIDNLDEACLYQMAETLKYLAKKRRKIYYESVETYNTWLDWMSSKEDL